MNKKAGRPKGSKNTPRRTLDLRDFIPEPEPKFKITLSQRRLLKSFNPDGLPDFRTKEFKQLSYQEKENYILEQLEIAIENKKLKKQEKKKRQYLGRDYIEIDVSYFPHYNDDDNLREEEELRPYFYKIYKHGSIKRKIII